MNQNKILTYPGTVTNNNCFPVELKSAGATAAGPIVTVAGVPFAKGLLTPSDPVRVINVDNQEVPFVLDARSHWSDGSIRWCWLKVLVEDSSGQLWLDNSGKHTPHEAVLQVSDENSLEVIDCKGELSYRFEPDSIFPVIGRRGSIICDGSARLEVTDAQGHPLEVTFMKPVVSASDSLSVQVCVEGCVLFASNQQLNIKLLYDVTADQRLLVNCEVHNPKRAMHPDGIWDLGDAGSVLFNSLNLRLTGSADSIHLKTEQSQPWQSLLPRSSFSLYQASSGGEHWDCPTHVNRLKQCNNEFRGFRLSVGDATAGSGDRASPSVAIQAESNQWMAITPLEFWQNFPKKLQYNDGALCIGLFPQIEGDCHEIQGGERKQHRIRFDFGIDLENLTQNSENATNSLPWLPDSSYYSVGNVLGNPVGEKSEGYEQLLFSSFDSDKGFLAKREAQDEYGWRNFGDVVADHETLYHTDGSYFISHYNNQYDCIYGFARQFLLSGDVRWYQLMDELARHVLDIDIYRTDEDRAEYNHGLFWHTDHYRKASTATHRTYSKDHYPADWQGPKGGGPGPEHCYTTGLKLYYFVSGNEDAKETVVRMTDWITNYYEGSGTFIEYGKSIASHDLKKFVTTIKGQEVLRYRYPFNRGVGNYIRALLDSYELTDDVDYIIKAENVITDTFSASDNIAMRNLDNIEETWFYTVFLQEVIRYLDVKRLAQQFDSMFYKALNALLHYAYWMADNEKPYLVQTEKLEYPNDTWAAQDIRKANVLYGAYQYSRENRAPLLDSARFFRDYVTDHLSQSETLYFARIQALLLQNHGPAGAMNSECEPHDVPVEAADCHNDPSLYRRSDIVRSAVKGLVKVAKTTSPQREYAWVRARLGK